MPKISVIMGILSRANRLASLERALNSILAQSYSNFEFLICDDGSDNEILSFLDYLSLVDCRIRILRQGTLYSLPQKLNFCLQNATGDYIARMDDDDFAYAKRFELQLSYLGAHPNIAFSGCNVRLIRDSLPYGERIFPEFPSVRDFFFIQPFIHPSLIFRRQALDAVNGYSEDLQCVLCEDYDLLLRLYAAGFSGANLQQILLDYTIPTTAKGSRKMHHRCNEVITRYKRFRQLGVLSEAWPYVLKPVAVGLLPETILKRFKDNYSIRGRSGE